jgi:hypothetical protein
LALYNRDSPRAEREGQLIFVNWRACRIYRDTNAGQTSVAFPIDGEVVDAKQN